MSENKKAMSDFIQDDRFDLKLYLSYLVTQYKIHHKDDDSLTVKYRAR